MTENEAIKLLKKANRNNDMVCIFPKSDIGKCLIKALEEIQLYHAIGTVEECREAAEKQKPKRPVERFNGDEWVCECPACRGITESPNEVDVRCIQYCGWCGQKLDWEELT